MDIKNRLKKTKNSKVEQNINNENKENSVLIKNKFDNEIVVNIITSQLESGNNIIFVTENSMDNNYTAEYFENCIKDTPVMTVYDKNITDINIGNSIINIIPLVSPKSMVNILEQILLGTGTFIMGIHLNSYDNILEKLKLLITLNSNLQDTGVNLLLFNSNAIIVNIQLNENGALYVKTIDRIKGSCKKVCLNNLYSYMDKPPEIDNTESEDTADENIVVDENITVPKEVIIPKENMTDDKLQVTEEISNIISDKEEVTFNNNNKNAEELPKNAADGETRIKINKYKLLKEKIKRKKETETNK